MLAYASRRPRHSDRPSSPHAMLVIIAVHVAAVAALMSAKMDLPEPLTRTPTFIDFITEDEPPPPQAVEPRVDTSASPSRLDQPPAVVPLPPLDQPTVDPTPIPVPSVDPVPQPRVEPRPGVVPPPRATPMTIPARLITHPEELKPPYPASKLASGEEAVLRLRLTIDERGRVVAVEPVGPADGAFLAAARRHLLARWRYKPATEDGRAVATSLVVTLRFEIQ